MLKYITTQLNWVRFSSVQDVVIVNNYDNGKLNDESHTICQQQQKRRSHHPAIYSVDSFYEWKSNDILLNENIYLVLLLFLLELFPFWPVSSSSSA